MRRVHFKQLESHRKPLFQLYRRLIKYSYHVPLSVNYQIYLRTEISNRFHDGKKIMAPSIAREKLATASEWEAKMRQAITTELDSPKKENVYTKWIQNQIDTYMRDSLAQHHSAADQKLVWNPPKEGKDLEAYKCLSRVQFQRSKMIKTYQKQGILSPRVDKLDPTYIDYVLLPEWMARQDRERTKKQQKLETEKPQKAHVVYVPTPLGRIYFLRKPGLQSQALTRFIHDSVHTKLMTKMEELEDLEQLALLEAKWEHELANSGYTETELKDQWTGPVTNAILDLKLQKKKFERKTTQYISTIVSRKRLADIQFKGQQERKIQKWQEIEKEQKDQPYLYLIHSDARRMK